MIDIPPALQRELDSFAEWRLKPINRDRDGVSVEAVTVAGNKADALRLLGWLKSEKNIAPSFGGVFGSERLGQAVQAFVEHLRACGRTYATCAGYIKSFIAVARFVHAARVARAPRGEAVSTTAVDAMRRAHRQIMQQARLEQKFSAKPKAWLDWPAVLTARARAVSQYELRKEEGGPGARTRLFDAALLTWLTVVPPDRVGVARKLQLGVTLKPTAGGGFELDLRTPDAHKTAALFGPSTTPVPAAACALLRAWLAEAGLAAAASSPTSSCSAAAAAAAPPSTTPSRSTRALDRGRQGRAQAPGGRAFGAQGPAQLLHHLPAERRQPGRGAQEGRGARDAPLAGAAGLGGVRQGARRAHVGLGRAGGGRVRRRASREGRAHVASPWGARGVPWYGKRVWRA